MKLGSRIVRLIGYSSDKRRNRRRERQESKRRASEGYPTLASYSLERARNYKR